jgi:hypothetical protein
VIRVRKLLLCLAATGLLVVPAAVAAPLADVSNRLERQALRAEAQSKLRIATARAKRKTTPPAPPVSPALQSIAQCESGGDPHAIGGGGLYRGKYQFSVDTWASVGGSGDPAAAPEAEQDRRAALLYARSGPGQWPVCGS